jgi:hypothetical protein
MIAFFAAIAASPLFHWIGGAIIGFAGGVWLDVILKRRDDGEGLIQPADKATAMAAANLSIEDQQCRLSGLSPQIANCSKSGAPYEVLDVSHGQVLSTVRIGIKNSGGSPLSNCKVYIEKMLPTPNLPAGLPILFEAGGFTLRHDDPEKLIDIAAHWGHVDRYRFHAPHGWFAETLNYLDDKIDRIIVIKVLAFESQRSAF